MASNLFITTFIVFEKLKNLYMSVTFNANAFKTTATVGGYAAKVAEFNATMNVYTGFVRDPLRPGGWTTCMWGKNGKCKNRVRPELDLNFKNL